MYKIKLKDMPTLIFSNCTEKDRKSIMDKYLEKHKDADPETVLEFNVPNCFASEEEQKEQILRFLHFYTNSVNRFHIDFYEYNYVDIAKQYNGLVKSVGKFMVPPTEIVGKLDTTAEAEDRMVLTTSEKGRLIFGYEWYGHADEYYSTRRTLISQHSDKQGTKERSRTFVPEDIDTLVKIHKIMVVYEYAKKMASKLTVKLTKDSVFNLFVNLVEKKFFGENHHYFSNVAFSQEECEFLSKLVDSLDPQIVKEAYANAEKSATKINETQAQVGASV